MPSGLDDVLEAFLGLYTKDKLAQWKELFLPGFVASATNADGTVTSYNLDEFYERQRALFASGKPVSETMMNTEKSRSGRLAAVRSDYIWTDGTAKKPGRLMMLLVEEQGRFRIQALAFSYVN
jgi:hypothetical protein